MMAHRQTAIVIISHSQKLALGLRELIQAMARNVLILTAAGDEEGGLGTQVETIVQAIEQAGTENALLFFDLGSALMNAEMAVEMVGMGDSRIEVTLVDAPLVEGAFAAAMALQTGGSAPDAVRAATKTRKERKIQ